MTERIERTLADLRARQTAGEHMPCPRCGRDTMKPVLHTNALSRHADGIYICDECGSAEGMLDFMRRPLPLEFWALFRENTGDSDFGDVPGEEAMPTINGEHVPRLIRIFQKWKTGETQPSELRAEAFRECPGLTQLWEQPFQALYQVADGEIVVRFQEKDDTVVFAIDLLQKGK